ncbi:hypothetical protein WJX72_011172 [[Myrmecia] bisecta]|uniref:Uncharacterized protein n=1 Tax=[Myrmecia] bisecta TaxID=41462 RepID=A0AAW1QTC6_9CHLO
MSILVSFLFGKAIGRAEREEQPEQRCSTLEADFKRQLAAQESAHKAVITRLKTDQNLLIAKIGKLESGLKEL